MYKVNFKNCSGTEVAVIGMAGRFPGAKNLDIFWQNLLDGKECISFFTKEEMLEDGVDTQLFDNPNYVNAAGIIEDVDKFDADFFKYNPHDAKRLNPQDRIFLELAWQSFENAGYDILKYKKPVGVFIGLASTQYPLFKTQNILLNNENAWQEYILGNSSFLPTRVSFHLNLTGPSMAVQTACSSSLVAVHIACQSLLSGECTMALAGGISISEFQKIGYLYQKEMILSADGRCRAFDEQSSGTVPGNGAGVIILKRLEDAVKDRDRIDAIIKGSAINNDGGSKIGYTVPSAFGHARVITEALQASNINPETISYIEAHGTGTIVGDPIEIEAFTQAYQQFTRKKNFCLLGSVKTNIGHLYYAAGIAGLIKTILCLKHKKIPPSLHFKRPNLNIDFANSPFTVNASLTDWENVEFPRRAGVSSLGMGGTNAHVILEEAPKYLTQNNNKRKSRLILFSAKSADSLSSLFVNYLNFLTNNYTVNIDDLSYTLQTGRHHYNHRAMLVCDHISVLCDALNNKGDYKFKIGCEYEQLKIVFMFPEKIEEFLSINKYFCQLFPTYKKVVEVCADILLPLLKIDIRDFLNIEVKNNLTGLKNELSQVLTFVVEYSLAKLLLDFNVKPSYVIGYGVGEYVAACVSGIFSLDDALALVFLGKDRELTHEFQQKLNKTTFRPPQYAIISSLSGDMVINNEMSGIDYWLKRIVIPALSVDIPVRIFQEIVNPLFLEVGSGNFLSSSIIEVAPVFESKILTIIPNNVSKQKIEETFNLILGNLWLLGLEPDFSVFYYKEDRLPISLPTYSFMKKSYWIKLLPNDNQNKLTDNSEMVECKSVVNVDNLESKIIEIWKKVFEIEEIKPHDDFFALGGDSLTAIEVISQVKASLNIDLTLANILRAPSVYKLSNFIKSMLDNNMDDIDQGIIDLQEDVI